MTLNLFFVVFSWLFSWGTTAPQNPVTWTYSAKKLGDKKYELRLAATVEGGWHIYSQTTPKGGPFPTTIKFVKNPLVIPAGKIKEDGYMQIKHEEVFGVDVHYYDEKVEFVQVVTLKANVKTSISGSVEFMVCDEEKCLPPKTIPFSISIQ